MQRKAEESRQLLQVQCNAEPNIKRKSSFPSCWKVTTQQDGTTISSLAIMRVIAPTCSMHILHFEFDAYTSSVAAKIVQMFISRLAASSSSGPLFRCSGCPQPGGSAQLSTLLYAVPGWRARPASRRLPSKLLDRQRLSCESDGGDDEADTLSLFVSISAPVLWTRCT